VIRPAILFQSFSLRAVDPSWPPRIARQKGWL